MEKLARDLVICGIDDNSDELKAIFSEMINAAVSAQASLGNKATWRNVEYYNQEEANQKANLKSNQEATNQANQADQANQANQANQSNQANQANQQE